MGAIGCFSTYACHILVTGVGGIATTSDRELAALMRSLVNHGRDGIYFSMDDARGKRGEELREVMEGRFRFVRMGYSYRITELEAALGVGQLETAPENLRSRRAVAARLLDGLSRWEDLLQLPRPRPDRDHSYMMFPVLLREDAPFDRDALTLHLEERGIETRPMVTVLNQPFYRSRLGADSERDYPVARGIALRGFYVGCHPEMDERAVERVVEAFAVFLARH
jgi:dTDP-4-amino-4,6-dideoxygalactose transaminase